MTHKDPALLIQTEDQPGVLFQLTRVIAAHQANISYIDIVGRLREHASVYLELQDVSDLDHLIQELRALPVVRSIEQPEPFLKIYGKRVIIIGGGAQVGQVALGAISEADRHNIRGERISVDTIPLVGEAELAAAVRAVARLPRVRVLVMAGALMGGDITQAVTGVKEKGIIVISLNMAGSVPQEADLIVSDPVQAGVMAVMAVADTAKFDIGRQRHRRY
jgi:energy-converting hydrogenase B subunit Q